MALTDSSLSPEDTTVGLQLLLDLVEQGPPDLAIRARDFLVAHLNEALAVVPTATPARAGKPKPGKLKRNLQY